MGNSRNVVCPTMIWLSGSFVLVSIWCPSCPVKTVIIVLSGSPEVDAVWVQVFIDVGGSWLTDWFPVEARKHCHCIQPAHVCHLNAANKHQHNDLKFILLDPVRQFFDPVELVDLTFPEEVAFQNVREAARTRAGPGEL